MSWIKMIHPSLGPLESPFIWLFLNFLEFNDEKYGLEHLGDSCNFVDEKSKTHWL